MHMHFNIYGKLYYDSKLFPAFPIPELDIPAWGHGTCTASPNWCHACFMICFGQWNVNASVTSEKSLKSHCVVLLYLFPLLWQQHVSDRAAPLSWLSKWKWHVQQEQSFNGCIYEQQQQKIHFCCCKPLGFLELFVTASQPIKSWLI